MITEEKATVAGDRADRRVQWYIEDAEAKQLKKTLTKICKKNIMFILLKTIPLKVSIAFKAT